MKLSRNSAMKLLFSFAALAVTAAALTPSEMLAAPRRSDATPNPSGTLAVFSETTYSWEEHESLTHWSLLDLATGEVSLLFNGSDIAEFVWLGPNDTSVIYVNGSNSEVEGGVEIWVSDVTDIEGGYKAASIPAPLSGLKASKTASGDINFLMYGKAIANGTAPYNEELVEEPLSSARIYSDIYVRHWDVWLTPETYTVWAGVLSGANSSAYTFDGVLKNLLARVKGAESPVQPFGDQGDYDITADGQTVAFLSKAPELPKANYTSSYIYLVPHDGSSTATPINGHKVPVTPKNARGASACPRFSPDGTKIAYLQMDEDKYEADRNKLYVATIGGSITGAATDWDRSADGLGWSPDGNSIYLRVPDMARERLFSIPSTAPADYVPQNLTNEGTVTAFHTLPNSSVLVTTSSIWSPTDYYIASVNGIKPLFAANEHDEILSDLSSADVEEFWYEGNWTQIQGFIIKPTGFSPDKTYPLAFIVHGGPQSMTGNTWSNRWNLKVWADQGYVVVATNPTGSLSFGEELTDKIQNNWGGSPYEDLVLGWEYIKENYPYIDVGNGIAAGASFGGYMMNWIQGHDLGRKFKALVTHDGSTNTQAQYTSEELWFMQHDFNGTPWDNPFNYARWNPINHIKEWATPHFVVHNELDYRLPVSEGIMLFNILQERGVPSRFLSFADENHWVLNRENSLVWHTEIFKWINHYSGIAP